jgi:uncharacterized protein (DUF302 family)
LDLNGGMSAAVTSRSRATFSETVELLLSSIAQAGGTLFATIDQRAAAETVGLVLRPTTLLIFGNPKGGTPLMEAYPLAALDLPLKVLVWEDDTGVFVSYVPIDTLAARYGVLGHEKLLANFERTLADVVGAVM